ncbi:MAG: amidohydrolase family protein [Erythrobacter sp.]|jgi:predicted TIM-barrel fold metal-dependent hydrolase|nr:amidohydrolase family protein [Erythrobacter sp.]
MPHSTRPVGRLAAMVTLLTDQARQSLLAGERLPRLPIPSHIVSNGEFTPPAQSAALKRYERAVLERAQKAAGTDLSRISRWLASPIGMANAFGALNEVFDTDFALGEGETEDADEAEAQRAALADQFVFDDQVHFLRDDADPAMFEPLTGLIELSAELLGLPHAPSRAGAFDIEQIKFAHFIKAIYLDSDTKVALLSGAPSEGVPMLSNDQMAAARAAVNGVVGERRLLTHAVLSPGQDGWLDEIDRVHEVLKPDGWKGYTVGEPFSPSFKRYRLDDEALMYPAYERMAKAGVRNVCIHKGLLPENADEVMPGAEPFAKVDDVGKAARDWPQLNFVIYHAGYRTIPQPTIAELERFEATGRIDWVSDLAAIPERYGVQNVYADIGASFAFTVLTHPRLAAAMIGMLVKGLGADKVLWGTDSVWYGSPQWQIEALRRLRMPEDLVERFGYQPLGEADGPLKRAILGENAAPLYGVDPADYRKSAIKGRHLDRIVETYRSEGGTPDNAVHGYAHPERPSDA